MFVELLQPMEFGTGIKKIGDVVDLAHPLAEDLIRAGRATWPKGSKEREAAEKAKTKAKKVEKKSAKKKKTQKAQAAEADTETIVNDDAAIADAVPAAGKE